MFTGKKKRNQGLHLFIILLAFITSIAYAADDPQAQAEISWWPASLEGTLSQAGTNRTEWIEALKAVPPGQRDGLRFLLENMPAPDLQQLSSKFVLEDLTLAYRGFDEAPWSQTIPKEIFLNDILPYACANERRDPWRRRLRDLCLPLVKDSTTPGQAADKINQKLFDLVKVKYSTQRKKADQNPIETMESGMATCTGLSILLIDACRSVGIPARLVGTPMWVNMRGNHTWVEVWDRRWHFVGAAEPDPNGLDHGWFVNDASQAVKDNPRHAIYATSFRKTGLSFPMVWASKIEWVSAVNVTDNYKPVSLAAVSDKTRLQVKILDHPSGRRVIAKVSVQDVNDPGVRFQGMSRGESSDLNDILPFEVSKGRSYKIEAELDGKRVQQIVTMPANGEQLAVLSLNKATAKPAAQTANPLKPAQAAKLNKELTGFFSASPDRQAKWKFSWSMERLLRNNEPEVRRAAWEAYRSAPVHNDLKRDFDAHQVRFEQHLSPYTVKTVGTRPANGWALFIAMHGGGGTAKEVNDSQWAIMQRYYKDHSEEGGYFYVALRAPDDTWNGFYTDYTYPLIDNLIREFQLFGDIDPNKVFIMGYSHGGYGAFAIGPKMPDHFAAIHASAAAPTDGETTAKTLRSTLFTFMIGGKDTAYGRIDRCRKFDEEVQKLRGERKDIYPVTMQLVPDNGHTGLPDKDKIKEMYPAVRNPVPREISWQMTDGVIRNFFWLNVPNPSKNQEVDAVCSDNQFIVTTSNVVSGTLYFDSRLVDFKRPVKINVNGKTVARKFTPSLKTLCKTIMQREDPELAFSAEAPLPL